MSSVTKRFSRLKGQIRGGITRSLLWRLWSSENADFIKFRPQLPQKNPGELSAHWKIRLAVHGGRHRFLDKILSSSDCDNSHRKHVCQRLSCVYIPRYSCELRKHSMNRNGTSVHIVYSSFSVISGWLIWWSRLRSHASSAEFFFYLWLREKILEILWIQSSWIFSLEQRSSDVRWSGNPSRNSESLDW